MGVSILQNIGMYIEADVHMSFGVEMLSQHN